MRTFILMVLIACQSAFADYSFLLRDKRYPHRPFSASLPASNKEGTITFESYLAKGRVMRDQDGNPEIGIINGDIVPAERSSRHDWDFKFDERTIAFADFTTEVCDGQFLDIESDPDYWFNTLGHFCPWSTRMLVDEIRRDGQLIYLRQK